MKRLPFLDWLRGLAVLIMIECHVFNSFARPDVRQGGPYMLSQFVGGMAAPLFLFMAGMTLAFQMEGLDRREPNRWRRWLGALRRGGYVLGIAYLFRLTNWALSLPHADWREITKVDILNCMGVAMLLFSAAAMAPAAYRLRWTVGGALAIAAASPLIAGLDWSRSPELLRDYLLPPNGTGRSPIFPTAAYVGFGIAAGTMVKLTAGERLDRLMQWSVLGGFGLIFGAQYFSSIPYSLYERSSFWSDSPSLILIRVGVALLLMAASYLWTVYRPAAGWSWMEALGKNSLMVYWVHVMLVYGDTLKRFKGALGIPQTALATAAVTALMVALSAAWLEWKSRRHEARGVPLKASAYSSGGTP